MHVLRLQMVLMYSAMLHSLNEGLFSHHLFTPCSITELIYHCTYQIKSSLFQATMAHSTETHMHIKHTHTHTYKDRLQSGRLEKTTRSSSSHHVAQHRPTGSETTQPYAPQSSRFGSELPSVEEDVDVWRYAIVRVACQKR